MTKASATKVFSIKTRTTTNTTVSKISRTTSRACSSFLEPVFVLPLGLGVGCGLALPLAAVVVDETLGREAVVRSSAMGHPYRKKDRRTGQPESAHYQVI